LVRKHNGFTTYNDHPLLRMNFLDTSTNKFCRGDHIWSWVSNGSDEKIPEGLPCLCGQKIAHYELCPECKQVVFKMEDKGV